MTGLAAVLRECRLLPICSAKPVVDAAIEPKLLPNFGTPGTAQGHVTSFCGTQENHDNDERRSTRSAGARCGRRGDAIGAHRLGAARPATRHLKEPAHA